MCRVQPIGYAIKMCACTFNNHVPSGRRVAPQVLMKLRCSPRLLAAVCARMWLIKGRALAHSSKEKKVVRCTMIAAVICRTKCTRVHTHACMHTQFTNTHNTRITHTYTQTSDNVFVCGRSENECSGCVYQRCRSSRSIGQ